MMGATTYAEFLEAKSQGGEDHGFDPTDLPGFLYPFQEHLVRWALRKGRAAIFADCGLGKTPMQLVWADQVVRHTNGRVLILTPLAVSFQTVREAEKFGIEVVQRRTGIEQSDRIIVTNYERLDRFDPHDFAGCVCDESSILKNFSGATRKAITEFMRCLSYRLLCTATAAPNDYIELGTSSEAIGDMGFVDMVSTFFKKTETCRSRKEEWKAGLYRFRGHAEPDFWRWVCSWSRAVRRPSDLGFEDAGFILPPVQYLDHVVRADDKPDGMLFELPAVGLQEQRAELRRTLRQRCERAAEIAGSHGSPCVAWCHLNDEGHLLEKLIPGSVEVEGSDPDEFKEEAFVSFSRGEFRVMVSKPTIAGFGLNWQHAPRQTFFPSHSYEQFYQCVRRSWRYGQAFPVVVDVITTEGQSDVLKNLRRKAAAADRMFGELVRLSTHGRSVHKAELHTENVEVPAWA